MFSLPIYRFFLLSYIYGRPFCNVTPWRLRHIFQKLLSLISSLWIKCTMYTIPNMRKTPSCRGASSGFELGSGRRPETPSTPDFNKIR